jgi:hypothetical protein
VLYLIYQNLLPEMIVILRATILGQ